MSESHELIPAALNALAARLRTMTNPIPRRVIADPSESVSLADFPFIVLSLDPERKDHSFERKAVGVYLYRFYVAIWVMVGSRQAGLPQLHAHALRWPVGIGQVILADQRISNTVSWSGDGGATGALFTHSVGYLGWGDGQYFGLKFSLPLSIALPTQFG
ncbi:MAG: hypothetical protein IAE79_02880 [Anaerolinea sp.]|nr:hypothetical protein [Anaerolinea sp.]